MTASDVTTKYSQGEEQCHILDAVASVTTGRFLDIGAWNAKHLSNTRALYEAGWAGVMIEPSPEPFLSLLREYGSDSRMALICAAVGFDRSLTRFYATADAVSTSSEENYAKWQNAAAFYGSFWAPVITIPEILNQFGCFEFVNIDTEGTSVDLFHSLLRTAMRPQCVCVEHDNRIVECAGSAQTAGYQQLYLNGENVIYGR